MKLNLTINLADNHPDRVALTKLLEVFAETIGDIANVNVTTDATNDIAVSVHSAGSGRMWVVWAGDNVVWSYNTIDEQPMPDALELWNALAAHVPMREEDLQ